MGPRSKPTSNKRKLLLVVLVVTWSACVGAWFYFEPLAPRHEGKTVLEWVDFFGKSYKLSGRSPFDRGRTIGIITNLTSPEVVCGFGIQAFPELQEFFQPSLSFKAINAIDRKIPFRKTNGDLLFNSYYERFWTREAVARNWMKSYLSQGDFREEFYTDMDDETIVRTWVFMYPRDGVFFLKYAAINGGSGFERRRAREALIWYLKHDPYSVVPKGDTNFWNFLVFTNKTF